MSDSYDAHDVTCRREHECDGCGYPIRKGWGAITWSWVEDGHGWGRSYWHPACYGRAKDGGELHDDGMLPLLQDADDWMPLVRAFAAWEDVREVRAGRRSEPETVEGLVALVEEEVDLPLEEVGVLCALARSPADEQEWVAIGKPSGVWSLLRRHDGELGRWEPHGTFADALEAFARDVALLGHTCPYDGCARSDEHYHYHYGDEVAG